MPEQPVKRLIIALRSPHFVALLGVRTAPSSFPLLAVPCRLYTPLLLPPSTSARSLSLQPSFAPRLHFTRSHRRVPFSFGSAGNPAPIHHNSSRPPLPHFHHLLSHTLTADLLLAHLPQHSASYQTLPRFLIQHLDISLRSRLSSNKQAEGSQSKAVA